MRNRVFSLVAGLALAVLSSSMIGGVAGLVAGAVLGIGGAVAAARLLARQPDPAVVAQHRLVAGDLPFATDLLAAALRAGTTPDAAAACVGDAVGGATGQRLERVARALRLGAGAAEAWSYLGPVAGVTRVVDAATRSQHSGSALAGSLQRVADDLRADRLIAADAAARRAAVLIVLPLGLCFLPAFVLTGLVPVIVAVLGDVLVS